MNYMQEITFLFHLDDSTQIQLNNAKTRDFYVLLNRTIHTVRQTGPMNRPFAAKPSRDLLFINYGLQL